MSFLSLRPCREVLESLAMKHQMQRLQELAVANGPLCVGLDTSPAYLPPSLTDVIPPAEAVLRFNERLIERIAQDKTAACFKVQVAYYEAMGVEGMRAFVATLRCVRQSGLVCISDVKRGDIAATAKAYAQAHFAGDFEADIITVNPYMGFDTLEPFVTFCENEGKGIFVLLCTSNPGAADIERQRLSSGEQVMDLVGGEIEQLCDKLHRLFPDETCGAVGAVVGCTQAAEAKSLREAHRGVFFLVPGYGAQGGDASICKVLLAGAGGVVNSSRGILCAWKNDPTCCQKQQRGCPLTIDDVVEAAAKAALTAKKDLMSSGGAQG